MDIEGVRLQPPTETLREPGDLMRTFKQALLPGDYDSARSWKSTYQLFLDSLVSPRLHVCPYRPQTAQSHWFNPFCKRNSTVKFPRQKMGIIPA